MLREILLNPKQIDILEADIPEIRDDEVLVKVAFCGICGSDLHSYYGAHPSMKYPEVQGHEFSGTIAKLGSKLQGLQGQKVVVEPSLSCGKCYLCRTGRYNICSSLKVMGFHAPGAFQEYVNVPVDKVISIPSDMDLSTAALVEPTAVAVRAVKRALMKGGEKVAILGSGPIGLLLLQVAKSMDADKAIVTDVISYRLEMAKKMGADCAINVAKNEIEEAVKKHFPDGADVIFEAVGKEETIRNAISIARRGSKIVIVGVPPGDLNVQMFAIQDGELEVIGTLMYMKQDFEDAIRLIHEGKVKADLLITKRFNLAEMKDAYKYIEDNKENTLKVMIQVGQD